VVRADKDGHPHSIWDGDIGAINVRLQRASLARRVGPLHMGTKRAGHFRRRELLPRALFSSSGENGPSSHPGIEICVANSERKICCGNFATPTVAHPIPKKLQNLLQLILFNLTANLVKE
jgi:hypothetical protein